MAESEILCPKCFGPNITCNDKSDCQQHTCDDCDFVHMPYPKEDLHD